jgi:hypothetical protein
MPSAYSMRRTDSASSSTSTVTAGNNMHLGDATAEDAGRKSPKQQSLKPEVAHSSTDTSDLPRGGGGFEGAPKRRGYHRRDYSGASTASSLSVGGCSFESYGRPRGKCARERQYGFVHFPAAHHPNLTHIRFCSPSWRCGRRVVGS